MHSRFSAYAVYLAYEAGTSFWSAMVFTAAALYMIQIVHLDALQLVLVGTTLEASAFVFEVPTGIVADTVSRRLSIVLGSVLVGIGFVVWAIPGFAWILVAQVLWGIGSTFQSGADEAWISDELQGRDVGRAYLRGAQVGYSFAALGIGAGVALGSVALQLPIVLGGVGYLFVAMVLGLVMPERHFRPEREVGVSRLSAMLGTLRTGIRTVRGSSVLLTILAITFIGGAASEAFDRLWPLHLVANFAFPGVPNLTPITWFGIVDVVGLLASIAVAEAIRRRVNTDTHVGAARALLVIDSLLVGSIAILALAISFEVALASVLISRILRRISNPISAAWINQSLTPAIRATVLSMSNQADAIGQIAGGPILGFVALIAGTRLTMVAVAAVLAPSLLLYLRTIALHGRDVVTEEGSYT